MNSTTPSIYDDPNLQSARTAYEGAQRQATETEASAMSLPTMLKDALTKKFATPDNPLVAGRERALKDYLTVSESAPLDVTHKSAGGRADVVYTPLEQSSIIGAKRAGAVAPLSTANYLLGLAEGGISDTIDSASRAAGAEATRSQGRATLARQSYMDILNELAGKAEEAWKEKEFNEGVRQFNVSQANKNLGSVDEQKATAALKRDIARGNTFNELATRYGGDLPEYVIREAYNAGPVAKKYGPAKETSADLIKGLSEIKKAKPLDKDVINTQKNISKQLDQVASNYDKLTNTDKALSVIPGISRVNVNIANYETAKNLITTDLARLRQKGVLSDYDVKQALALFPPAASSSDAAKAKIQQVRDYIEERISSNTGQDKKEGKDNNDPLGLF